VNGFGYKGWKNPSSRSSASDMKPTLVSGLMAEMFR
jgi:hypothetical protein